MKNLINHLQPAHIRAVVLIAFLSTAVSVLQAQNPTDAALGYNIFVKNGATLESGKSEGAVAIGGDFTLSGDYRIAHKEAGSFVVGNQPLGLLVGGKILYSKGTETGVEKGYVKIGNGVGSTVWYVDDKGKTANIRLTAGNAYDAKPYLSLNNKPEDFGGVSATVNPVIQGGLIDFNQAFVTMQAKALALSAFTTNIQLYDSQEVLTGNTITAVNINGEIKVNLKLGYNILNITGAELNSVTKKFTVKNKADADHVLVINVNAPGSFDWNVWEQSGVGSPESAYIFYNFYNTTNLQIAGDKDVEGTLFAPFADINKTNTKGNIEGQLVALSYKQISGDNKLAIFAPSIPNADPNKLPKPTQGASLPVYTNKALTSVSLSFTKGNGLGRIVIAQKAGEPGDVADFKAYTGNATFGLGSAIGSGYVVYRGTGNAVTVKGLQAGALYYFSVLEYNGEDAATVYNNSAKLVTSTTTPVDTDGDTVPDALDDYPTDASRAFNNYFPATGYGTLMFEDRWPYKGDYDFNDLVVDYKINTITNATNKIAAVEYIFLPKASGATSKIGFAFQLDGIAPSAITSVSGTKLTPGFTTISSNGTEAGHVANANIVVFENAFKMFKNLPANADLINTYPANQKYDADTIKVVVTPQANSMSFESLTSANFNPYIFVDLERGKEIHLADRLPSAKMNYTYLGTGDDQSIVSTGKYFKTIGKLPWALNIVTSVPHVQEGVDLIKAYVNFTKWALSDGNNNKDWYMDGQSNRKEEFLFMK